MVVGLEDSDPIPSLGVAIIEKYPEFFGIPVFVTEFFGLHRTWAMRGSWHPRRLSCGIAIAIAIAIAVSLPPGVTYLWKGGRFGSFQTSLAVTYRYK
mmetsp:Transcript_6621/g.19032  ORF Transcript_6621/g.19032 Transcript_6621/m.19032 type:complete len:97 (+) Transcript_6621:360-650(+)